MWRDAVVGGAEARVLLNALQERSLWRTVLLQEQGVGMRTASSLAALCASASRLLGSYDINNRFERAAAIPGSDADSFAWWHRRFVDRCVDAGLLPQSHVDAELAALLREGRMPVAHEFVLYGFDRLTPAQNLLVTALEAAGAGVLQVEASSPQSTPPQLAKCASAADEMIACAEWIRSVLTAQPQAQIAIIVPDLDTCRAELERTLRAVVAPESADVTGAPETAALPYEFSVGRPLARLPLAADALRLLRWCAGSLPVDDAGALLRTSRLQLAPTPDQGAELDAFVLHDAEALRGELSLREAATLLAISNETAQALRTLALAADDANNGQHTYAWLADTCRELLARAGWPGPAALSSEEFQAVERWNETLDRLASLDLLGERTNLHAFLDELTAAARETLFAPENTAAPVQVMTVTETAGSTATHLWFLHAEESTWPPRPSAHPLLPVPLQRALGLPGADAATDEATAHALTERLIRSATAAVFSYAAHTAQGTEQRPSSLLQQLPPWMPEATALAASEAEVMLEPADDNMPLPPLPAGVVRGGVGVLTAQAQCAFRAVAEKRLFATLPEAAEAGLSAGDRGEQVHKVLQLFWLEVKTQSQLLTMTKTLGNDGVSERDRLLRRLIEQVLRERPRHAWETAYLDVQRERLFRVLSNWLDAEATRPAFTVTDVELEVDAEVGPLLLKLRVDRIDRVTAAGGEGTLLIDYKTGPAKPVMWQGERMDQPQLPVYAVTGGIPDVEGIAFASVRVQKDGMKLEGVASDGKLISPRAKNVDFPLRITEWSEAVQALATAFANGDSEVDPKEYPKTCDHCGQRMLCRLDVAKLELADTDDEDDDEVFSWA